MRFFRFVGVLLVIILAFTAFSAFDCGDSKAIISIALTHTDTVTLVYDPPDGNTTWTYMANVVYDDESTGDGTDEVTWESQDEGVAMFDENVLYPVAVGSTHVRATAENGDVYTPWYDVVVNPPFTVLSGTASANPTSIDIDDTSTLTMLAAIDTDNDEVADITDYNATSITSWSVTGGTGDGTIAGNVFTATDDGDVTITGTFQDGDVELAAAITDTVTITVLPPVSVALTASTTSPTFTGVNPTTIDLTAVPDGDTVVDYDWTATGGGDLAETNTTGAANSLDIDYNDAGNAITVTVTANFTGGAEASDEVTITVDDAVGPTFDDMTVNGTSVADGGTAPGPYSAGEGLTVVASATDGDGGDVSYSWSATNGANVTPTTGATVTVTQSTPDANTVVTCTASDNNGGDTAQRTFDFDVTLAPPEQMELRLRAITPGDPSQIRIVCETGDMSEPMLGVNAKWTHDDAKVSGVAGFRSPDNIWAEPGLDLYMVAGFNPVDMTYSTASPTGPQTTGCPIFYVDYNVLSGSGTTTNFEFVEGESVYVNAGGSQVSADVYTNALGVPVP
jgi:hypothetical protein